MVYHSASDLDFRLEELPVMPRPPRVLMARPDYFDVQYVINPHMEGHIGGINKGRALEQWSVLKEQYATLGVQPAVLDGAEGLPDLVFCANQTLPYVLPDGSRGVILSRMHAEQRRAEVPLLQQFFARQGLEVKTLPEDTPGSFEGMGDAIWHPNRFLLWGGYGYRTEEAVYQSIAALLDVRVLVLQLVDPAFYHLDTCFSVLDERSVLIFPEAFTPDGIRLIEGVFERVLTVPRQEAMEGFACNAHCPDGKHVLIQEGCTETERTLTSAGFIPVPLATDEYLKSGGSVFCMKLMYWS